MSHVVGLDNVESLLQVHSRAKGLVACAREDGASQLGLRVVPFPESAELNGGFYGQTVSIFRAVDGYEEDVFSREAHDAVFDMRIWVLNPLRHWVPCSRSRHCE